MSKERDRDTGRFAHEENWDRLCVCGHTLGNHTAASTGKYRPCIEPTCECECEKFKPAKKNK